MDAQAHSQLGKMQLSNAELIRDYVMDGIGAPGLGGNVTTQEPVFMVPETPEQVAACLADPVLRICSPS